MPGTPSLARAAWRRRTRTRGAAPPARRGGGALGAIALNLAVGGLYPLAGEIAAREGARLVWLPTVDSENERRSHAAAPPGATPPMWSRIQDEMRERGITGDPVAVTGGG